MGRADYLELADWNAVCDKCGRKFKASELRLEWDNLYVCPADFEYRQPQDFVRGTADIQTPPWTRPDPPPIFLAFCSVSDQSAIPGIATPGCSIPGNTKLEHA